MNNEIAFKIKQSVSLSDVLGFYGIRQDRKRIPCPIHNGKNDNFEIKEQFYRCYSCGESGDVISFVMRMEHCGFAEACRIIDERFNLGALKPVSFGEHRKINRTIVQRKVVHNTYDELLTAYLDALVAVTDCQAILRDNKPKYQDKPPDEMYTRALIEIEVLQYKCDCAEIRLRSFEKEGEHNS